MSRQNMIIRRTFGRGQFELVRQFSAQPVAAKQNISKFEQEWANAKPFSEVPRISTYQIIRRFLPGGKYYKKPLVDMHKLMKAEFGSLVIFPGMFGRPQMAMSYNVEDAEKVFLNQQLTGIITLTFQFKVFRNEGPQPNRRALETLVHYRKKVRPDIYGEVGGLFSSQGEEWYNMRTVVNPVLLQPRIAKMYIPRIDEISAEFVGIIAKKRDEKNEVPANFGDYLNKWSLESVTCIALDTRLNIMNDTSDDENSQKLIKLIRQFFVLGYDFEVMPSVWRVYETKAFKNLLNVYDEMTNIIMHYVDNAVEKMKNSPPTIDREQSILEKLLKINKNVAVVMAADSMLAGVDTTSSAVTGILYCLAKNPEKQKILREELKKIMPNKDSPLTSDSLTNIPYLRAVMKEGMRLYPPTGGNVRKTGQDLVVAGYQIPKGLDIVMALQLLAYDENQYVQSKTFIPERWLKDNTDPKCPHSKDAHPFSYLPFGFGPRMCVGRRLAELEIEVVVARMIRSYDLAWNYEDMKIKSVLVNIPDSEMKFQMTEVNE
ncbi:unnamed protein product [Diamesa serratosioi]